MVNPLIVPIFLSSFPPDRGGGLLDGGIGDTVSTHNDSPSFSPLRGALPPSLHKTLDNAHRLVKSVVFSFSSGGRKERKPNCPHCATVREGISLKSLGGIFGPEINVLFKILWLWYQFLMLVA